MFVKMYAICTYTHFYNKLYYIHMTNYAANISIFSKELLYVEQGGRGEGGVKF